MTYQKVYSDDFLNSKRLIGDAAADLFIQQVFKNPDQKKALQLWLSDINGDSQLNNLIALFPDTPIISNAAQLPAWANKRLMTGGSDFFIRHSTMIMSLLGLLSLPYCYTAADGARVLYLSERIRTDTTKRLYETAVFVWEVMAPNAFGPNGKAFTEVLKVRLMHAMVRYYTLQSGSWDSAWGLPINQEDMAGTNLSFSLLVIRGLRMLGFTVSQADQLAFMHLWDVIGYLTGLDEDLITQSPQKARMLDEAISNRQFRSSEHGKELTNSLTDHIISINKSKATSNDILGLMKYLLGNDVALMLGLEVPDLPAYKIGLLRTMNYLKSFKPLGNTDSAYKKAYAIFKLQKPA